MSNPRRERFLAWYKRTYRDQDGELNRARFMADTGKSGLEPLTKGRVSQLFDEKQPFGEVAARRLAERLLLRPDFFDSEDRDEVASPRDAASTEEIERWRMSVADESRFGSHGVIMTPQGSGKSTLLRAMVTFASLAKSGVEPPQRKLLAQMVGSLFEDGPSENTAKAIDALTPQLDEPARKLTVADERDELDRLRAWHNAIFSMAEHEPGRDREAIVRFLIKVQTALAENSGAQGKAATPAKGHAGVST